jgi:hypothetical protein
MSASPRVGKSSQDRILNSVDLPAPCITTRMRGSSSGAKGSYIVAKQTQTAGSSYTKAEVLNSNLHAGWFPCCWIFLAQTNDLNDIVRIVSAASDWRSRGRSRDDALTFRRNIVVLIWKGKGRISLIIVVTCLIMAAFSKCTFDCRPAVDEQHQTNQQEKLNRKSTNICTGREIRERMKQMID